MLLLGTNALASDVAVAAADAGRFRRVVAVGPIPGGRRDDQRRIDFFERGAPRRLAALIAEISPTLIVQLAASQSPVTPSRRGRYDLTIARVVSSAVRLWYGRGGRLRRMIVLSSTCVYGLARSSPLLFRESDYPPGGEDVEPYSAYGRWVRELRDAEDLYRDVARDLSLDLLVLRAASVFGGPLSSPLGDYLSASLPLRVFGYDPPQQVVHYGDLVQAIERALEERATGTLNVVARGAVPLSRVAALAGRFVPPVPSVVARLFAPAALGVGALRWRCVADGSRATQVLGVSPAVRAEDAVAG
jgi:nucleoside-diphosphate-sugar epimerase